MARLKSILAGAFAALMLSESAFALSCMRPDLVRSLEEVKASPKLYHVFVGRFVSNARKRPRSGYDVELQNQFRTRPPEVTRARFEGFSLASSHRFDQPLSGFPVDIETSCAASWCGNVPDSNQELIAFVEARRGQPPILRISACPSYTFQADAQKVRKVRQCLDKTCESDTLGW